MIGPKTIRRKRRAQEMTQAELAALVGCSPSYICRIELGQRTPAATIDRMREALGATR